jgi:hypothetical protein
MGTELTVVSVEKYPALIDGSELREALAANTRGVGFQESDLVRVKTPAGGSTKWAIPGVAGEEIVEEVSGLLVYFAPHGVLWPSQEVAGEGQLPLLVTTDLVTARRVGDDYGDIDPDELEQFANRDGTYSWPELPWNQWGSGKGGVGKRCKESRLLMILREGEAFPLLIRAQPGSLKTVRPFIMRLPIPHWRAVVGLRLQATQSRAGVRYAQIVPRLIGSVSKEVGQVVKGLYTDPLAHMAASGGVGVGASGDSEASEGL